MSYKVIVDSCGELTEDMKKSGLFETASLSMEVGGVRIIDDEDLCAFLQLFIEMLLHMRIQREPHARPGFDLPGILRGSHDDRFFVPA